MFDPPRGVGAELAALRGIEAFDSLDQANVAFADQVEERETEIVVIVGDLYDQSQIRGDHVVASRLVAVFDTACELNFLLRCQEFGFADLLHVGPQSATRVVAHGAAGVRYLFGGRAGDARSGRS